jgi:asparagine synthase (glutamine-hydrolysing)
MCGVAGILARHGSPDEGALRRMAAALAHRGPDDLGIHRAGPFAVLQTRLSIIDLERGHQPMVDDAFALAANGEIYNFVELRRELEGQGDSFRSTSDTEVILAAYRRWGRDCLAHFNGMFAFALWDAARRELVCARDRLGVKPFYYQWDGRRFAFASEPEALVLTQSWRVRPRLEAIRDLVALDWVDHEAGTFFEGLHSLPAAHLLVVGESGPRVERWWSLRAGRAEGDAAAREERFADLFTDAVRLRLRADVEVGSCLSGGLDSSAVVTTASRLIPQPVHAFTCAYDEGPEYDERAWVRDTVAASGARSDLVVPDGHDFWATFDRLAVRQSEPTAGPGLYSQWKVMELAHGHGLKVLLDGQGGDETLAGYFRYLPVSLRDRVARGDLAGFLRGLPPVARRLGMRTALALTFEPWLPGRLVAPLRRRFGQGKDRVLSPALRRLARTDLPAPPRGFPSGLSRQLAFDTLARLLPSLLRYEDRNSMAFSIETRLPFLDYRLVEYAFTLPDVARLDGVTTKAILRRALADRIPSSVLARRDKMGFETPTDRWLRQRHAGEVRRRLLTRGPLHEWLDPGALALELEGYLAGRRAIGVQVWRWLSLEAWARRYAAADPRLARPAEVEVHAGAHRSYEERALELERDARSGAASVAGASRDS